MHRLRLFPSIFVCFYLLDIVDQQNRQKHITTSIHTHSRFLPTAYILRSRAARRSSTTCPPFIIPPVVGPPGAINGRCEKRGNLISHGSTWLFTISRSLLVAPNHLHRLPRLPALILSRQSAVDMDSPTTLPPNPMQMAAAAEGLPVGSYYQDPPNDLSGGLPINLDSLRDGPPGSKPFYPYSTLIRCVNPFSGMAARRDVLFGRLATLCLSY